MKNCKKAGSGAGSGTVSRRVLGLVSYHIPPLIHSHISPPISFLSSAPPYPLSLFSPPHSFRHLPQHHNRQLIRFSPPFLFKYFSNLFYHYHKSYPQSFSLFIISSPSFSKACPPHTLYQRFIIIYHYKYLFNSSKFRCPSTLALSFLILIFLSHYCQSLF